MVAKIGHLWAAKGFSKIDFLSYLFFVDFSVLDLLSLVKVVEMKKVSVGRFGPCC